MKRVWKTIASAFWTALACATAAWAIAKVLGSASASFDLAGPEITHAAIAMVVGFAAAMAALSKTALGARSGPLSIVFTSQMGAAAGVASLIGASGENPLHIANLGDIALYAIPVGALVGVTCQVLFVLLKDAVDRH
jgi:hypothetical protein